MEYHQNRYARALDTASFPSCRWLDLGAGCRLHGGWLGRPAGTVASRARWLVGCDLLSEHLRRHPDLTHRVGASGDHLPFRDGSFDLVSANMVLEHLAAPERVFAEVGRVLAPGGRFVFVTPHLGHPAVLGMALFVTPRWRRDLARLWERRALEHIFTTFYRANTPDAIHRLASAAGLEVEALERFSSFPITNRYPGLRTVERWWIRFADTRWGARFRSNLLGVLRSRGVQGAKCRVREESLKGARCKV